MRGKHKSNAMKTLALLCLVAHSLFVSATHFHGVDRIDSSITGAIATTGSGESHGATDTSSESHCLSCRLQRNFISDVRAPSVILEIIPEEPGCEIFLTEPHSCGPFLILSDRAPPLV